MSFNAGVQNCGSELSKGLLSDVCPPYQINTGIVPNVFSFSPSLEVRKDWRARETQPYTGKATQMH